MNIFITAGIGAEIYIDARRGSGGDASHHRTIEQKLDHIIENMATQNQLNEALDKVETALTFEIEEIKTELKASGIPDTALDRLSALSERISGIIGEHKDEPATDTGEAATDAAA